MERWARVGRGAAAASFATFFAAFSHAAAGSTAPGAVGVLLAFAFAVLVCTALAGRRLSLPRLVTGVLASQLLFHVLFGVGVGVDGMSADWSQHLGHHGEVIGTLPSAEGVSAVHGGHDGVWMWAAHALAALATVAVAVWGLRLARGLAAILDAGIRLVLARAAALLPVETSAPRLSSSAETVEWVPHARLLLSRMRHRGPPASALLASAHA